LLEQHALTLYLALSEVAARAAAGDGEFSVDADGRLHVRRLSALSDPPSLVDLAARTKTMVPKPICRSSSEKALGGGLLAAVYGMRFVVPVPSIYARHNRKYFVAKRGWRG
jgi:hypothetical protein